ncbi:hypothetical protein K1T71_002821 [Dendrolimus kikuchii]|uniref:Uncharacterized protein n=1 Tax=Dendrolimus kikuchii TaxID=765133 RepID=A0ACC1DDS6_9NEOP|nr:hypothetical protein K1T71_002821 [Dendrolimus kikuchii]
MDKKPEDQGVCGQVRRYKDRTPDLPSELSFEELRNKFDCTTTHQVVRREIASKPATHGSATRQLVSGKVFKKCKSATFQIDGATYTIGFTCLKSLLRQDRKSNNLHLSNFKLYCQIVKHNFLWNSLFCDLV